MKAGVTTVQFGFELQQQQTQQLAMTTQMRQALEMLEFDTDTLNDFLASRAQQNVFLRVDIGSPRRSSLTSGNSGSVDERISAEWSLAERLKQQIRLDGGQRFDKVGRLAVALVDDIDGKGYLSPYSDSLGLRFGCMAHQYEAAVRLIQACDPLGIGARDLQECLVLQLPSLPLAIQPLVEQLICDHLPDIAHGNIATVARRLHKAPHEVQPAVDGLRQLNPRPGTALSGPTAPLLRADLRIEPVPDGYVVVVNDGIGSFVHADPLYLRLIRSAPDSETRTYLGGQWREARWLQRCVHQRSATLHSIGDAIVELQPEFIEGGRGGLRPMTLRDVADYIGVHESTVSRAIRGKAVAVPSGCFELRTLFSARLDSVVGASISGNASAESLKHTIRAWIVDEDAAQPLTDAVIAERFAALGTQVSRRTIAKYRDALTIPGAPARKRYDSPIRKDS